MLNAARIRLASRRTAFALGLPLFVATGIVSPAMAQDDDGEETSVGARASLSRDRAKADAEADEGPKAKGPELRKWSTVKTGAQAGFRTGFALGLGKFSGLGENLSDNSRGYVPLWLDVGYRVHPNVYFGLYGQFGFMLLRQGGICEGEQTRCSGQDYRVGAALHYHFMPDSPVDLWFGLGAGYEWYRNSVKYAESGLPNRSVTYKGPEWVNAIIALDIKDSRQGGVGPYVGASFGQFTGTKLTGTVVDGEVKDVSEAIATTEPHQWIMFGIQGSYFDDFL